MISEDHAMLKTEVMMLKYSDASQKKLQFNVY